MSISSAILNAQSKIEAAYTAVDNKGGTLPETQNLSNLATAISSITTNGGGSSPVISSLSITPSTSAQTITASSGTDGYSPINVSAVTSSIDANITAGNIKSGVTILGVEGSYTGSGSSGRYTIGQIVQDDYGNSIGTVSGFFGTGNNQVAVVCLNSSYRGTGEYLSGNAIVTGVPTISDLKVLDESINTLTATTNCTYILNFCAANNVSSGAVSHCRSIYITINNTTYYGQLPNVIEMFDIYKNLSTINDNDDTISTYGKLSTSDTYWTSNQSSTAYSWFFRSSGLGTGSKTSGTYKVAPILELPNV